MSEKNKTIKQKNEELSKLIEWFNGTDIDLEEALKKYKEAEELAADIEKDLLSMKNQIQVIKKKFDQ